MTLAGFAPLAAAPPAAPPQFTARDFSAPDPAAVRRQLADASPAEQSALYCDLSRALEDDDTAAARAAADRAHTTARTPLDALRADLRVAWVIRRTGDAHEALRLAEAGEKRAAALHDDLDQADFRLLKGYALGNLSRFPEAVEALQSAVVLAEALPDLPFRARAHQIFGVVYGDVPNAEKPELAEFERAAKIAEPFGPSLALAWAIADIGNMYNGQNRFAEARRYYDRALAIIHAAGGSKRMEADLCINVCLLCTAEGKPADGIPFGQRAVTLHSSLGLKRNLSNAYKALAIAEREAGQLDESLRQFQLGLTVAEPLNTPGLLMRYYTELALLYEKRGDWRSVTAYERKATEQREASANQATQLRLKELEAKYEVEQQRRDLQILQQNHALQAADLKAARLERIALAGGLLFVVAATGVVIGRQRLLLRAKNQIVSETQAARLLAEEANRLKTRFLGIAAHDIKSPLAAVLYFAGELRNEAEAIGNPDERLHMIMNEVRRVLRHTRDFLDIAALGTGRLELNLAPVSPAAIVREILAEMRWHTEAKAQSMVFTESVPVGRISADGARLHQVFSNLIDNACKFSPPGSVIAIDLCRAGDWWKLSVRDQGPGLSAEKIAKLYEPFTRLGGKTTGGEWSHGYGLSIALEIAQLHGGRIGVESPPGAGCTFTVEVPFKEK